MSAKHAFWITNDLYDLKNNLKPHLQQKKYMADILQKDGTREFIFYDLEIDLAIAETGFGFKILNKGQVPQ